MAQTQALVAALKKTLKAHGLTYRDVAKALRLSEPSVKRLFNSENFSLARLDQVCQLMEMEISDLVRRMDASSRQLVELTEEQEREIAADVRLLLVVFLVINGWTFDDMLKSYQLSETETIRYLARLDKLKVIELLPNNRIKLLISPRFSWRKNGPIQQFFTENLQEDFLASRFSHPGESLMFLSGMLSPASSEGLIKKMERLAADFNDQNQEDRHLPIHQRLGCSMILAMRPWRPEIFQKLRRS